MRSSLVLVLLALALAGCGHRSAGDCTGFNVGALHRPDPKPNLHLKFTPELIHLDFAYA